VPPTVWVEQTARGTYRDKLLETTEHIDFTTGDTVSFDPFPDSHLNTVYCMFVQYVDDDERIAEIRVPPAAKHSTSWFDEPCGNYWVHERYLTPR